MNILRGRKLFLYALLMLTFILSINTAQAEGVMQKLRKLVGSEQAAAEIEAGNSEELGWLAKWRGTRYNNYLKEREKHLIKKEEKHKHNTQIKQQTNTNSLTNQVNREVAILFDLFNKTIKTLDKGLAIIEDSKHLKKHPQFHTKIKTQSRHSIEILKKQLATQKQAINERKPTYLTTITKAPTKTKS